MAGTSKLVAVSVASLAEREPLCMQRGCDEIVVIMSPTNFAMNVMIIIYLLLSVSLTAASSDNETIIKGDIKSTHTWTACILSETNSYI